MKKKIVFLVSGNGGNLKFLYYLTQLYSLPFEISYVIGDRHCGAIDFSEQNKINFALIDFNQNNDLKLIEQLKRINPDYIITNVHKILSENTVNQYKTKLINLHYSLLPSFSGLIGMKPVDLSIEKNVRFIGTTVHYVNKKVDNGKIIGQNIFELTNDEEKHLVYDRIFRSGALNLWNTLAYKESLIYKKIKTVNILNKQVIFSPELLELEEFYNDIFWMQIKV